MGKCGALSSEFLRKIGPYTVSDHLENHQDLIGTMTSHMIGPNKSGQNAELEMNDAPIYLPDFESAQHRTDYIRNNATHFTITFRLDRKNRTFIYSSLEKARKNALVAAKVYHKVVMIYAVLGPYDSWIENVHHSKTEKPTK